MNPLALGGGALAIALTMVSNTNSGHAGVSQMPAGSSAAVQAGQVPSAEIRPATVARESIGFRVAPQHSRPFGHSYGEWVIAWWRWAIRTPAAISPLLKADSTNCGAGIQPDHVRFLGGNFTGSTDDPPVERGCTVSEGTAFFLPVLNGVWASTPAPNPGCSAFAADPWYGSRPGDPTYREFLRTIYQPVGIDPDNPKGSLTLSIDGKRVPGVQNWYLRTKVFFNALLPDDNVFDAIVNFDCYNRIKVSPNVGYGYYAFIYPLPPGHHTIRWTADAALPFLGTPHQDVTYHVTVRPKR